MSKRLSKGDYLLIQYKEVTHLGQLKTVGYNNLFSEYCIKLIYPTKGAVVLTNSQFYKELPTDLIKVLGPDICISTAITLYCSSSSNKSSSDLKRIS